MKKLIGRKMAGEMEPGAGERNAIAAMPGKMGVPNKAAKGHLLEWVVIAAMLVFGAAGHGIAQNAAEQHAAAIRAQLPAAFKMTQTTGNISQLQNHVVITGAGAIYNVMKSNALIANYSVPAVADPNDPSAANNAGKAFPVSVKCRDVITLAYPAMSSPPVSDACRRDLAMGKAKMIKAGQRVLLTGIDLHVDKDRVDFTLLEHHKSQGAELPRFLSQFTVQFPGGFLMNADAGKIAEAMKPFLAPSSGAMFQAVLPDAPAPTYTLEDNLYAMLSPTAYQLDTEAVERGAVLHVIAEGFMRGVPQGVITMGCTLTLRDGQAKKASGLCKNPDQYAVTFMKPEDDLVVSAVKVESKKDKQVVRVEVVNMSQADNVPKFGGAAGHYRGTIDMEFPKDSLNNGDIQKVKAQLTAAFRIDGELPVPAAGNASEANAVPSAEPLTGAPAASAPPAVPKTLTVAAVQPSAGPPQTLEEQLKSFYKLTTLDNARIVSRGTTLTVTSDKLLLGTPYAKQPMCASSVTDSAAKPPAAACVAALRTAIAKHEAMYFPKGQKLDVVAISVDMPNETVEFSLIDDPSAAGPARFHTMIKFVFPKGYLEDSDAGQVGGLVSSVLETSAGKA